jgi:hypothetical protein
MHHKPRAFVRNAKHTVKLMRRYSLFGRPDKVHRKPPFCQWDLAALENGPDGRRKLTFALVAVIETVAMGMLFALDLGDLILVRIAAMRAKWTVRPNDGLKRFAGCGFIGEAGILKVG